MTTEADRRLGAAYLTSLPVKAARALEAMAPADAAACLASFEPNVVAPTVSAMRAGAALAALIQMPAAQAQKVLTELEPTSATALLRLADATQRDSLLDGLEGRQARRLRRVAGYPVNTAGAWCDPMAPVWPASTPAGDVADAIRQTENGPHDPICAIRDDGGFLGCVRITDIVSAPVETPLRHLVMGDLVPALDMSTIADALNLDGWLDFSELPVIDRRGRHVGRLSRRALLVAAGEAPPETPWAGDDLISGAMAGTASWLGVILEAALSRKAD